ncbi:AraC family transcriptional regulator ligand-binding domain-containing protein [Sphingorhabdus sp.]|jgi:AraC-like DNA-binding protein|uniref:AraC family transcriptional regulator ligand-binding domain-containing protein n=1 Tax=Sphingorhabdus sp. TaxID=1902408 RepID=UPI003BB16B76|nr:AraC family transcriptional regulator ligand-binding domain-containing protein [Sphingomonadales bacterium]MBK9431580.1 AraC family transcriptional regulator ligand-binding domain-containing protein [Sphingomonadales bacterium]
MARRRHPSSGAKKGAKSIRHWVSEILPDVGAIQPGMVGTNFVGRILRGAVDLGASRPRLLDALGLSEASIRNPIGQLSSILLARLFEAIEQQLSEPTAALILGVSARPSCFSDLGFITRFAETPRQTIAETVSMQTFRQAVWKIEAQFGNREASLVWNGKGLDDQYLAPSLEFSAASYSNMAREGPTDGLPLKEVHFRHLPRFDPAIYDSHFGVKVRFGALNTALIFDNASLDMPSPRANAALQQAILERFSQPPKWIRVGKRYSALCFVYLAAELNKSPLTLDRIAASYGTTERTLRRHLAEEGWPFRKLLDHVRKNMCDLYRLEGERSLSQVAELLGYSELSAFSRAFSRWYGVAPRKTWSEMLTEGENGGRSKD